MINNQKYMNLKKQMHIKNNGHSEKVMDKQADIYYEYIQASMERNRIIKSRGKRKQSIVVDKSIHQDQTTKCMFIYQLINNRRINQLQKMSHL